MKLRYKTNGIETYGSRFNPCGLSEVLTGDDSVPIGELDVWIGNEWVDMRTAFKNKQIIPDNYNMFFSEPKNDSDKERGYFL